MFTIIGARYRIISYYVITCVVFSYISDLAVLAPVRMPSPPFHPSQLYLQSVLGPGEVIFSIIVAYFNTSKHRRLDMLESSRRTRDLLFCAAHVRSISMYWV